MIRLDSIDAALASLRDGRPVVVVDDEDRENEGDLIMPAATTTPEWMGFVVRHTSGVVCAPMPAARARALELPPMTVVNEDAKGTAYTVSCDAREGVSTGISAADRTVTVHALAAGTPDPRAITRPGHVFPLIARDGGVRERAGHTEAGVELCRLADLGEVAVIAELVHDAGDMMRAPALREFADDHGLTMISIADLIAWLEAREAGRADAEVPDAREAAPSADPQAGADSRIAAGEQAAAREPASAFDHAAAEVAGTEPIALPTPYGTFTTRAWRALDGAGAPTGPEHLTLVSPGAGAPAGAGAGAAADPTALLPGAGRGAGTAAEAASGTGASAGTAPLVRVHSECLTGDVLGSHRCDCGEQLTASLRMIAERGGVLVYMRGHEGRGIGLWEKLRAYALQDSGADTVEANLRLGHPADARDYRDAAAILRELGASAGIRLLTNNPAKIAGLRALGIEVVERVPVEVPSREENARYLATKRDRMQHLLGGSVLPSSAQPSATQSPSNQPPATQPPSTQPPGALTCA
jgi:3,4-dihydroxy 2-butanone 4-phosphate synthase/GTP cyclohydrolase II